jgi:hypothetical protein
VPDAFIKKLSGHRLLSQEDVALLVAACGRPNDVPAGRDLIREGDRPGPLFVILEGWVCRYKLLPEGTRQITAFHRSTSPTHLGKRRYYSRKVCYMRLSRTRRFPTQTR